MKRNPPKGDLVPLTYYARIEATGNMAGIAFRLSCLEKLCKVSVGYSTWLPSAAYDSADVNVQWTDYELNSDGFYVRAARQSGQEVLASSPMKIAMQVTIDEAAKFSGGKLTPESALALLQMSLVDERAAAAVREVQMVLPKRTARTPPAPPLPFTFDDNHIISSVTSTYKFLGRGPAVGDVLLSIDGACCDGASSVVRSQLASEISHETAKCERARQTDDSREKAANLDGGRIIFRFGHPPAAGCHRLQHEW